MPVFTSTSADQVRWPRRTRISPSGMHLVSPTANGTSMYVSTGPAGAPNGAVTARPNSRTADITASRADVARRSCSSAPLMPDVGISRASCQLSSDTSPPNGLSEVTQDLNDGDGPASS